MRLLLQFSSEALLPKFPFFRLIILPYRRLENPFYLFDSALKLLLPIFLDKFFLPNILDTYSKIPRVNSVFTKMLGGRWLAEEGGIMTIKFREL